MKTRFFFSAFFIFLCITTFSQNQNTITEDQGETVKRLGNHAWFIKDIQKDVLRCATDSAKTCQLERSTIHEVEVVQVDSSFPTAKIITARNTNQPVEIWVSYIDTPRQNYFPGFSYHRPIQKTMIQYDKSKEMISSYLETGVIKEINWVSIIATIFVILFAVVIYGNKKDLFLSRDLSKFFMFYWFIVGLLGTFWLFAANVFQKTDGAHYGYPLVVLVVIIFLTWCHWFELNADKKITVTEFIWSKIPYNKRGYFLILLFIVMMIPFMGTFYYQSDVFFGQDWFFLTIGFSSVLSFLRASSLIRKEKLLQKNWNTFNEVDDDDGGGA